MTITLDPKNNESSALFDLMEFEGKQVLEIGSGDGRLTWLFANRAAHVTSIEPYEASYNKAKEDLPSELEGRVNFQNISFEEYAVASEAAAFDVVILSWSLC